MLGGLACSQNSLPLIKQPAEKAGDRYVAILTNQLCEALCIFGKF